MKTFKRIISSFLAVVISFSLCLTPVLAAWQNEVGHWYVNAGYAQWVVGGLLSWGGKTLGATAGTLVLPGGGTIEGAVLGSTLGTALSYGIYELADYYAAGYTDDDYYDAESEFLSGLDTTTANSGVSVTGFSVDTLTTPIGYYCHYYTNCTLNNLISDSAEDFYAVLHSLGVNNKVLVSGIWKSSPYYLFGVFFDENGQMMVGNFENPAGYSHYSQLGVYNLADLTLVGSAQPSWSSGGYGYNYPVYYSSAYADQNYSGTGIALALNWSELPYYGYGNNSSQCCFYFHSRNFSETAYWTGSMSLGLSFTCSLSYNSPYAAAVGSINWDSSRIIVQPSNTNSASRPSSLMQAINNYNIDNSYTDNSTTVNFYLAPSGETPTSDNVVSPAIYDEETLVFTEPATGAQYQTTGWTYDYTTRTYDITLDAGTFSLDGTDVTRIVSTYGDELATITYYDASGTALASDEYSYVMMSGSGCAIEGHSYNVETTKEANCTAAGERTYTCSVCGDQYVEEISKTDHVYADHTITQEPTCTVGGISSQTCSTCGSQITEKLDALGHDWIAKEVNETTYEIPEGTSCPDCSGTNYTFTRNGVIYTCTCSDCSAEWTVEADVTYGSTTYACSRCGETKVEADATEETQETWFTKFIYKFKWLSSIGTIYRQLIADITSDAATAAAVADGTVMLADVTGDHAATDGETVTYTAPELAISFGDSDLYGVDWASIKPLDLSWYAPHKETVDGIISGILWLSYLFLLIKRAPGIIRGAEMVTEDRIKIDNWNFRHRR